MLLTSSPRAKTQYQNACHLAGERCGGGGGGGINIQRHTHTHTVGGGGGGGRGGGGGGGMCNTPVSHHPRTVQAKRTLKLDPQTVFTLKVFP